MTTDCQQYSNFF